MDTVKAVWNSSDLYDCKMYILVKTLKAQKPGLRQLCKDKYGDLHNRLESKRRRLHLFQLDNLHSPHHDTLHAELIQYNLVQELSLAEEMFLRQKPRNQWIKEGDMNTYFFHNMVKRKHFKDQIKLLFDSEGNRLTAYDDIATEAVGFNKKLLGVADPSTSGGSIEEIRGLLSYQPTNFEVDTLIAGVTDDEIYIIKIFPNNKAPGPNGFTVEFFKSSWSVTGTLVCAVIREFFELGMLLGALNATWITLVPKCLNPSSMENFRPLSCSNVLNKCITKLISTRLKRVCQG